MTEKPAVTIEVETQLKAELKAVTVAIAANGMSDFQTSLSEPSPSIKKHRDGLTHMSAFDPKRTSAFNHNASSSSGANGSRHVVDLHLLVSIDEKMIETFDAN
jgi:hypothetical protein